MNPLNFLTGYKTIIAGIGLIGLGIYEVTEGRQDGFAHIAEGLGLLGLRAAIANTSGGLAANTKPQEGPAPK